MTALKLEQYGGQLPAWSDYLLPAGQASYSLNSYLFSGALTGWRAPKLLRSLTNSAARMAFRVPVTTKAAANANLVFVANVNAGDKIKVGEELYTFRATVTAEYDVLLGGSATASATNLFQALTATGVSGTTYGTGTYANPNINTTTSFQNVHDFGSGNIPLIYVEATDSGAAFNTVVVTESTAGFRAKWLYSPLSLLTGTTTTLQGGTNPVFDSAITGTATWLEFLDADTNVMRSPVVNDKFDRYYFASPSQPPQYNTYDRIQSGAAPFLLGVPAPGCEPIVSVTGGGDLAQLGYPTALTTDTNVPGSNHLFLIKITPTGAMTLNDVVTIPQDTSTTAKFVGVLYSDNTGAPFELLNVGDQVTGVIAGAQLTSTFTNPTGLAFGVSYWIGFLGDTDINIVKYDDVTSLGMDGVATYTNGPPNFAPSMSANSTWQIWSDLTTASVLAARAYTYTWVTAYGEEGPPAPPTLVNGWSNGQWSLELFSPSTDELGVTRIITKLRIYRTVASASGGTSYYYVDEIPVTQGTYTDTIDDSVVVLNNIVPSVLYYPPPEDLRDIRSMPNGISVGFRNNEIWFTEPFLPHAWNPGYVLTTEFPIVGLGVSGQTVVACTSSTPYAASGVNPGSMALTKTSQAEPCVSRGSILGTDMGVYYCSPNGLILVSQAGQVTNTTELWITRERWRALTPSKTTRAIMLSSSYFAFGSLNGNDNSEAQAGFTIELANDSQGFTIWPQPGGHRLGFNQLSAPGGFDIANVQTDPWTGTGLLIQNGGVYYYDFSDVAPTIQPFKWRSKIYQQNSRKNFEAMKVYFSVPPGTPSQNAVRNTASTLDASWNTLQTGQYGIVRVFADGVLVTAREIVRSGEMLRILSGFKTEEWQFEIEGRVLVSNLQVATSAKELGTV